VQLCTAFHLPFRAYFAERELEGPRGVRSSKLHIALDGAVIQLDYDANKNVCERKPSPQTYPKARSATQRLRLCNRSFALFRSAPAELLKTTRT
jgi:hypothetical protein